MRVRDSNGHLIHAFYYELGTCNSIWDKLSFTARPIAMRRVGFSTNKGHYAYFDQILLNLACLALSILLSDDVNFSTILI